MLADIAIASLMMLATTTLHIVGISVIVVLIKRHVSDWRNLNPLRRARKIGGVVMLMFFLSILEITAWAGVYLLVGAIKEMETALYFSTVTFTTLGYGDILLSSRWRLLGAFEAANGIMIFGMTTAAVVGTIQRVYFSDTSG